MDTEWEDAVDSKPTFIFDVKMKDGSIVEARYIMGNFETMDGKVLYPEYYRLKEYHILVPVAPSKDILTTRDECGSRISSALYTCPNCGARRR